MNLRARASRIANHYDITQRMAPEMSGATLPYIPNLDASGHVGFVMALAYGSQPDAARRYLAETEGRFAGVTLSPTQQSWLAYLHGEVLLDADPTTAFTEFTRAIDLADAAGSHYVGGVARVSAVTLQSRTAPALAALPLYADVIERWLDAGSWSHLLTTMRNLVLTLTEVGATEWAPVRSRCWQRMSRPWTGAIARWQRLRGHPGRP